MMSQIDIGEAIKNYDLIVCPGGAQGLSILGKNATLVQMLRDQRGSGKWYAAICAAPANFLERNELLEDKVATFHPGFADKLTDKSKIEEAVVISDNLVTGRGPGTSIEFGTTLVE